MKTVNFEKPVHISRIHVCYSETDRMGVLPHGAYTFYFEEARTDLMRKAGMSYKELEDSGIILSVCDIGFTYYQPAYYDDIRSFKVAMEEIHGVRLIFSVLPRPFQINSDSNISS